MILAPILFVPLDIWTVSQHNHSDSQHPTPQSCLSIDQSICNVIVTVSKYHNNSMKLPRRRVPRQARLMKPWLLILWLEIAQTAAEQGFFCARVYISSDIGRDTMPILRISSKSFNTFVCISDQTSQYKWWQTDIQTETWGVLIAKFQRSSSVSPQWIPRPELEESPLKLVIAQTTRTSVGKGYKNNGCLAPAYECDRPFKWRHAVRYVTVGQLQGCRVGSVIFYTKFRAVGTVVDRVIPWHQGTLIDLRNSASARAHKPWTQHFRGSQMLSSSGYRGNIGTRPVTWLLAIGQESLAVAISKAELATSALILQNMQNTTSMTLIDWPDTFSLTMQEIHSLNLQSVLTTMPLAPGPSRSRLNFSKELMVLHLQGKWNTESLIASDIQVTNTWQRVHWAS